MNQSSLPPNHERQDNLPLANQAANQTLTEQSQDSYNQSLSIAQYGVNPELPRPQAVENYPSYSPLHPRKTFLGRLKLLLKTLLLPMVLMGVGYVVLAVLGKEGLAPLNEWLNKIWLPATLIRIAVYAVLLFLVMPYLFRQVQQRKILNLQTIKQNYVQENGQIDLRQLDAIESEIQTTQTLRPPFLGLALILVLIELLFIQLPFILK